MCIFMVEHENNHVQRCKYLYLTQSAEAAEGRRSAGKVKSLWKSTPSNLTEFRIFRVLASLSQLYLFWPLFGFSTVSVHC